MNTPFKAALDDLAAEVRPVDLAPRVTRGLRRRRQRHIAAAAGTTLALVAAGTFTLARDPGSGSGVTAAPGTRPYDVVWVDAGSRDRGELFAARSGGEPVPLGPARPIAMDLSPDGRRIALVNATTIEVVEADGSRRTVGPALEAPQGMRPDVAWAPDGRRLAVTDVALGRMDPRGGADYRGYWIVDTVTGHADRVRYLHAGGGMSWSPDGRFLALNRSGGGLPKGIDVVTSQGRLVRSLGAGKDWYLRSPHAWSPDGTRLLIDSAERGGPGSLVVDATTGARVATVPPDQYVWHDARHLLRHRVDDGGRDVVVMALDGEIVRRVYAFPGTEDYSPGNVALRPAS